jgi:hypothetical protein
MARHLALPTWLCRYRLRVCHHYWPFVVGLAASSMTPAEREAAFSEVREHERFMWSPDATTEEKRASSKTFDAALARIESEVARLTEKVAHYIKESDKQFAAVARLERIEEAARDLYERVEMDESVGICLSDRVPSLRLGDALAAEEGEFRLTPGQRKTIQQAAGEEGGDR